MPKPVSKRAEFGCDVCGHTLLVPATPRDEAVSDDVECANCGQSFHVEFSATRTTLTEAEIAGAEIAGAEAEGRRRR